MSFAPYIVSPSVINAIQFVSTQHCPISQRGHGFTSVPLGNDANQGLRF